MLVKFTDVKGKDVWINPLYVKAIAEGKRGVTEIYITYGSVWSPQSVLKVDMPAEEAAMHISAAMPDAAEMAAIAATEEEQQSSQTSATSSAGATAMMG